MKLVSFISELYKMVCEPDEMDLDIHIPAVMLPQDAGATLQKMLLNSSSGILFLVWMIIKWTICCSKFMLYLSKLFYWMLLLLVLRFSPFLRPQ